jgi:NCS1 family nucleobase:cation symporter-1
LALLGIVCPFDLYFSCGAHTFTAGTPVPTAATHIFQLSFFTGFGVSGIAYYILNAIFPPPGAADKFEEIDVSGYEERMTSLDEDTNSNDNNIEKEPSSA